MDATETFELTNHGSPVQCPFGLALLVTANTVIVGVPGLGVYVSNSHLAARPQE